MSKRMRITPETRAEIALKKRMKQYPFFRKGAKKLKIIGRLLNQGGLWLVKEVISGTKLAQGVIKMTTDEIMEAIREHAAMVASACRNATRKIPRRVYQVC